MNGIVTGVAAFRSVSFILVISVRSSSPEILVLALMKTQDSTRNDEGYANSELAAQIYALSSVAG